MAAPVCVGLERNSAEKDNAVASCGTVPSSKTGYNQIKIAEKRLVIDWTGYSCELTGATVPLRMLV